MKIDLSQVKTIEIPDGGNLEYQLEDGNLIIDSKLNGDIVDGNFREIEAKINKIESSMEDLNSYLKLRFLGEVNRLKGEVERLNNSKLNYK